MSKTEGEKADDRKKAEEEWKCGKMELEGEADLRHPAGGPC